MEDSGTIRLRLLLRWVGIVALLVLCLSLAPSAYADHTPAPTSVSIPGSFQSELGCPGDWQPECAITALTAVAGTSNMRWRGQFVIPAASWEFKAAMNGAWLESYASPPTNGGGNMTLTVTSQPNVRFYYDHETHWVADSVNDRITVLVGDLQSELGCPGDWQPNCIATWMTDGDNDGIVEFETDALGGFTWHYKVAMQESWDENYGAGSAPNGTDIEINVPSGATVIFRFNLNTNTLSHQIIAGAGPDNNIFWDDLLHDSRDTTYRNPGGPVTQNTPVKLRIRAAANDLTSAELRLYNDRTNTETMVPMTRVFVDANYEYWEATAPASAVSTAYWYRFVLHDGTATAFYEDDTRRTGGVGQTLATSADRSWQLTVYDPALDTPEWVKNGVIYQIFPDRFRNGNTGNDTPPESFFYADPNETILRSNTAFGTGNLWNSPICDPRNSAIANPNCPNYYSNNFYGGDLQGITQKIAYLQSIGVTVIYLNPIFESPSNHKYDTTDYGIVDDNFGGDAAFDAFIAAADAAGMHVILDGVFNHTSSDSIYFDRYSRYAQLGACESASSPLRSWYFFSGSGPCAGQNYESWFGYDSLPKLNGANAAVRDLIWAGGGTPSSSSNIAAYWLQRGADGWRLDVGGDLDQGVFNSPGNDYWEGFHAAVNAATPGEEYIVGEEWNNATSWVVGDEWDATMNYQFSHAVLSFWRDETFTDNDHNNDNSTLAPLTPDQLNERLLHLQEIYPPEALYAMMNLLGSHDTSRALFMLDENADEAGTTRATYENPAYDWSDAITRLKGVALLQFTMPGAPTIYYGDEIGLVAPPTRDGSGWQDDPYNRIPFPWLGVDGNPEPGTGTPYYTHLQSEAEQEKLRDYYALLGNTRNAHPALRTGDFQTLQTHNANQTYVYGRRMANLSDSAVVFVNRSGVTRSITVDLNGYLPNGTTFTDALNPLSPVYTVMGGSLTVNNIPARYGALLVQTSGAALPMTPPVLTAISGNATVSLDWGDVTGATQYEVYRAPMSGGPYTSLGTTGVSNWTDNTVTNFTNYYYVVVARNGSGLTSEYSNEVLGAPGLPIGWCNTQWPPTMNHTAGALPTGEFYGKIWIDGYTSQAGQQSGIMAQLGYGANGSDAATWTWVNASYNIQSGNDDEYKGTFVITTPGTYKVMYRYSTTGGTSWQYCDLSGPTGPTTYTNASTLTVNANPDVTAPSEPGLLTVTAEGNGFVDLDWIASSDDESGVYQYEVLRGTTSGGPYSVIGTTTAVDTDYTDNTVVNTTTYFYVVRAVDNALNVSENSNEVEATPAPRDVTVTFRVSVPSFTPATDTIYIVGAQFCNWCNPQTIAMTKINASTWEYTTTLPEGTAVVYKYTRGTWEREEMWGPIAPFSDRNVTIVYGVGGTQLVDNTATNWNNGDSVAVEKTKGIANWRDPLVIDHSPLNGATGVAENTPIKVTWSRPMQGTPDFTVTSGGQPVAGTFSYDSGTNTSTFTPTGGAFGPNRSIAVFVSGEMAATGNQQQVNRSFSFTTGNTLGLPTYAEISGSGTCAKLSATVNLKFRNLNPGSTYRLTVEARHPGTSTVYMIRQINMTFTGPAGTQINFKGVIFPYNNNNALIPGGWTYNSTWTSLPSPNNPIEYWVSMSNLTTGSFTQTKISYTCNTSVATPLSTTYSPTTPVNYGP